MLGERVLQVWRWYLQRFRRYRKKTRGGLEIAPPPSGARVKKSKKVKFWNGFCLLNAYVSYSVLSQDFIGVICFGVGTMFRTVKIVIEIYNVMTLHT